MTKGFFSICVVCICCGVLPATAAATNSPMLFDDETPVGVGKLLQGTNIDPVVFQATDGSTLLSCEVGRLTGTVAKNDGSNFEWTVTSASFFNVGDEDCTGSIGTTKVTTNPTTNGLPWCIRSTSTMATHEFQIRGNQCSGLARPIRLVLDITAFGVTCVYSRSTPFVGTYVTGKSMSGQSMTIGGSESPLLEGSFVCPSKILLAIKLTLETDGSNRHAYFL
jgi:hypothetical protein